MLTKLEFGRRGEQIAARYMKDRGFIILERNWRYRRAEIDLIAKKGQLLVFIEVKSRSSGHFSPEESVGRYKEALIMDAAQRYMDKINYAWEIRFDIISIIMSQHCKTIKITHYKDAFFY